MTAIQSKRGPGRPTEANAIDFSTKNGIVVDYRNGSTVVSLLARKYGVAAATAKKILVDAGVTVPPRATKKAVVDHEVLTKNLRAVIGKVKVLNNKHAVKLQKTVTKILQQVA